MTRWFYSPHYNYGRNIPGCPTQLHGYLLDRPRRVREALIQDRVVSQHGFIEPEAIQLSDLQRVHTQGVIQGLSQRRTLTRVFNLGAFALAPFSVLYKAIAMPQMHAAQGTIEAVDYAFTTGMWAFNLLGGFHHAHPTFSQRFSLINDVALGLHMLRQRHNITPWTLILDLDANQGDGNIAAFSSTPEVFTASMHQESAFPHIKLSGDLDVPLQDYTDDTAYLAKLDTLLDTIRRDFTPELIIYLAGTAVYRFDSIASLNLTTHGILQRDLRVGRFARSLNAPLVTLPTGGNSKDSATLCTQTFTHLAQMAPA